MFVLERISSNLGKLPSIKYQAIWPNQSLAAIEANGKPFKIDSVSKKVDCSLLTLQSVTEKNIFQTKNSSPSIKIINNWLLSLLSQFSSEKIMSKKVRFSLEYRLKQCFLDQL